MPAWWICLSPHFLTEVLISPSLCSTGALCLSKTSFCFWIRHEALELPCLSVSSSFSLSSSRPGVLFLSMTATVAQALCTVLSEDLDSPQIAPLLCSELCRGLMALREGHSAHGCPRDCSIFPVTIWPFFVSSLTSCELNVLSTCLISVSFVSGPILSSRFCFCFVFFLTLNFLVGLGLTAIFLNESVCPSSHFQSSLACCIFL